MATPELLGATAPFKVVTSAGLHDAGPDMWLSLWQQAARQDGQDWTRVVQSDWDDPDPDAWADALAMTVDEARGARPVIVVGHSLGALAVVRASLSEAMPPVAGAFLVAPPDTGQELTRDEIARWGEGPWGRLPFPAAVVASHDDPWCAFERAATLAKSWDARLLDAGAAGHVAAADGHGPWPEGAGMLRDFVLSLRGPL